jgi:hypothetical protein
VKTSKTGDSAHANLLNYYMKQTNKRLDRIENKVDSLLATKVDIEHIKRQAKTRAAIAASLISGFISLLISTIGKH